MNQKYIIKLFHMQICFEGNQNHISSNYLFNEFPTSFS